jgi:hypothetical protein
MIVFKSHQSAPGKEDWKVMQKLPIKPRGKEGFEGVPKSSFFPKHPLPKKKEMCYHLFLYGTGGRLSFV